MSSAGVDNRALTDNFLRELQPGGRLHCVVQAVKKIGNLSLCFRGNDTPEKVDIYCQGHLACSIAILKGYKEVQFTVNLAHIDIIRDSIESLKDEVLKNEYFNAFNVYENFNATYKKLKRKKDPKAYKLGYSTLNKNINDITDEFAMEFILLSKRMVDTYFKEVDGHTEKQRQHEIFNMLKSTDTGLFAYDREFSQWFADKKQKGKKIFLDGPWKKHIARIIDIKKEEGYSEIIEKYKLSEAIDECLAKNTNEPDILAIRYEAGQPKALVYIEIKSTTGSMACGKGEKLNSSGPLAHMFRMYAYSNYNEHPYDFQVRRRNEACEIMKQYQALGLGDFAPDADLGLEKFGDLPFEHMLLLTDDALAYYNHKKKTADFNYLAEMFDCDICEWTSEKVLKGPF